MKGLLPPIAIRSKSEHSVHRTPRKVKASVTATTTQDKDKSRRNKASHRNGNGNGSNTSPITVDQISDDDRVVIETYANSGISLPAPASHEAKALAMQEQKQRNAAAEYYITNDINNGFNQANAEYQLRQQQNQQSPPHGAKSTQNQHKDNEEDDDNFDDFDDVEEDSLGGHEGHDRNDKNFSKSYQDEIVMGYDEDVHISSARPGAGAARPPIGNVNKSNSSMQSSLASQKRNSNNSRIPLPVRATKQINTTSTTTNINSIDSSAVSGTKGRPNIHAQQRVPLYNDDRDDDEISDISVDGLKNIGFTANSTIINDNPRNQNNNNTHTNNRNNNNQYSNPISQASTSDTTNVTKKNKKKRDPVWKMAPIPVRPYIAVPN